MHVQLCINAQGLIDHGQQLLPSTRYTNQLRQDLSPNFY
ncbi:hypothetical protein VCRA2114E365_10414 [Vibrio crassostreae]|uniref:Uncharacterized protein n=1 Tax=Vibrio crassostreae TaxID=246167 RepID=A0ABP1WWS8_9VIBR|nr:hypothetical protein VCRA2111O320_100060 [Vibrio crassostreae]CAK1714470.1 hypothetical protein VCRA2116O28_110059 [Vibrio crassostreae]CAK1731638.1 hypothetical protein VCRA2116O27_120061 [Vibrio crassostreae]CAK1741618.1 hypothetical protein VCRA2117O37_120078 [Vibrio crassostreae]CAK1743313.1 hypothetical protein VCRA2116O31_120078 [Vibrio crassostreae]